MPRTGRIAAANADSFLFPDTGWGVTGWGVTGWGVTGWGVTGWGVTGWGLRYL